MQEFVIKEYNSRLRYHDLPGAGAPIIFIHGLGCASSFDYPQVASVTGLAKHRRILVDLLGSGFSDKPEQFAYTIEAHANYLEEFINRLQLDHFFIYGHSMGGAVAINLAARFENKVAGLILSEANLDAGGGFFSQIIASYDEHTYINSGHKKTIQDNENDANQRWAISLSVASALAIHRQSRSLLDGQSPNWRQVLYSLNVPKTFIFGHLSLPDPDLTALENENINIEIVPDSGHSMAWDNASGLAAAILSGIYHALLVRHPKNIAYAS